MTEFDVKAINEQYINSFYREEVLCDYSVLKLAVSTHNIKESQFEYLLGQYKSHIEKHNLSLNESEYPNSGFDLFVAETCVFPGKDKDTRFLDLGIKCEMIYCKKSVGKFIESVHSNLSREDEDEIGLSYHTGFYLYPRSSISKTPLMLANHTGIIDSGYRGNMIAAVRSLGKEEYTVEKGTRLFQIVSPTLCPVYVVLVPEVELTSTERGAGGFGSTGQH
jgi:dUTP pyrophosphatase